MSTFNHLVKKKIPLPHKKRFSPESHPPLTQHSHPPRKYFKSKLFKDFRLSHIFTYNPDTLKLRHNNFTNTELTVSPGICKQVLNSLATPIIRVRSFILQNFHIPTSLSQFQNSSIDLSPIILSTSTI